MENLKTNAYDYYEKNDLASLDTMFNNVIGQDKLKYCLKKLINIVLNGDKLKEEDRWPYYGAILYTNLRVGKSFILNEIANNAVINTLMFKGAGENICTDLEETFERASELKDCLILIDDLDSLISYDTNVVSCLKDLMDNIDDENNNIFVIATLNNDDCIGENDLYQPAYFQYVISLDSSVENSYQYFEFRTKELNIKLSNELNKDGIIDLFNASSCDYGDINRLLSLYKLEYGNKTLTNILFERICYEWYKGKELDLVETDIKICVHEVGHAFMAYKCDFNLEVVYIENHGSDISGVTKAFYNKNTLKNLTSDIMYGLAGNIAKTLVYGKWDSYDGIDNDLSSIKIDAVKLITVKGYNKYSNVLYDKDDKDHTNSEYKLKLIDKQIDKLIDKYARKTKRILKANIKSIVAIAKILEKRVLLTATEFVSICNELDKTKDKNKIDEIIKKYQNKM